MRVRFNPGARLNLARHEVRIPTAARGPHYVLAFAAACALSGAYGFLQGAWPFGFVETVWTAVALRRWAKVRS
ncbi:hypothetical protein [Bradyrhizobium japonicum]|uniref:hypothetical protein n=1 Tax=Bradyrhizobium japonicum TaxID=375 RepID=UPI0020A1D4E3|nr:hypothetical protein [Bradyrhizobium japonicum]MCP1765759.1 hypothetical protein [Bradyrhizobium japonicum]MCP1787896.1 hypothetical protein [Bradyrhizobium japonicum]MCP1809772.1 hypothetical protein [Bradyrhizobium japonicum]MCP1818706.1 hypothetical protein [Bradyrhizobium japonicum]MCP1869784.1 hypothetical protein [Bradyrhizobium japonicum]